MNEARYVELARLWRVTGEPVDSGIEPRPSAGQIVARAEEARAARVIPLSAGERPGARVPAWAISAAAVLLLGLALGALWPGSRPGVSELAAMEITTGPEEMVTTRLNDGTMVRLAPESRLLVRGNSSAREVWLNGQGFFAVAHEEDRPFTVRTRVGDAIVMGTRFSIQVRERQVQVAVVEGRVALAANGERVEAAAGDVGHVTEGSPPRLEQGADLAPMLAWMGGYLAFQDTPLSVAALEIEARFGLRVLIADPEVGRRTISAWFTTESPGEVLSIVCRAAGAHCTLTDSIASIEP